MDITLTSRPMYYVSAGLIGISQNRSSRVRIYEQCQLLQLLQIIFLCEIIGRSNF